MSVEVQERRTHSPGVRKSGAPCDLADRKIGVVEQALGALNAKAKRELGMPTRPIEESVRRAIEWFRENGMLRPARN